MEADQVLEAYVKDMGSELGTLFHALSHELTWVHWRWNQYRLLFGLKPSRIELLNESAPFFFRVIQDVLFEETLLGIARLIDPLDSGTGKYNLTIQTLPPLCPPKIQDHIRTLAGEAVNAGEFAKDWRNRHIAHRDLDLALGKPARILEAATREKVEASLSALRYVLNAIEHEYCNGTITVYYSPSPWDAEALLHVLRDGLLREKDRQECWNRGERHADDFKALEPI
jgi:AbiU2